MLRALGLSILLLTPTLAARALDLTLLTPVSEDGVVARSVAQFTARIAAGSGGLVLRVRVQPDAASIPTAVAGGSAALGVFPLALLERENPVVAMDRVPYLASNFVDARKLWQVLRPQVVDLLAARGLTLLYAIPQPPPAPLSRRPLRSLAAWRGLRLVSNEPTLDALCRVLGAEAVNGATARQALSAGDADAALHAPDVAVRERAWEFASHFVDARAWFPKMLVVADRAALTRLSAGPRDALLNAADAAAAASWSIAEAATDDSVQRLRDYGIKATTPPVDLLIALEDLGRQLLFLWSDGAGEMGATLVERYYAIR